MFFDAPKYPEYKRPTVPYPDAPPKPIQKSLCYDFPLRDDYNAQLVIPRDITPREAERLSEFIKAVAASATNGRGNADV